MSDLDWGGAEEIRSLEAKVSVGGSSCGGCGDLAAKVEVGGREAKGLEDVGGVCEDRENRFGLVELDLELFGAKSVAPRSSDCFCGSASDDIFSPDVCGASEVLCFLISLTARMQPGFRWHCFFLQVKTCSLRSSLGKYSGRSPFSWRRSDVGLQQTLHLAKEAGAVFVGSSHACR